MKKIIILLCIFLTGCVSAVNHATPSGKVEATYEARYEETVAGMITDYMINNGYSVKEASKRVIVFEKPIDDIVTAMLYGSEYNSTPNSRVSYSINTYNEKTRVVASFFVVTNPGSGFEKLTTFDEDQDTIKYQVFLNDLKTRLSK